MGKVATLVAVVAVFFGSRGCNRYRASREARGAALEALSPIMGPDNARAVVDEHHATCFAAHYRTGWGRRARSTFDSEKYASCILQRAQPKLTDLKLEAAKASRRQPAPRPTQRVGSRPPPPPPTPTAAPAPSDGGFVALGDVKVLGFQREPQLMIRVSFLAVGRSGALRESATCSFAVECNGRPLGAPSGKRMLVSCPLKLDGAKGEGLLHLLLAESGPSEGACQLDLALSDGARLRSNPVVVPLS